jgi:hypothetical protein
MVDDYGFLTYQPVTSFSKCNNFCISTMTKKHNLKLLRCVIIAGHRLVHYYLGYEKLLFCNHNFPMFKFIFLCFRNVLLTEFSNVLYPLLPFRCFFRVQIIRLNSIFRFSALFLLKISCIFVPLTGYFSINTTGTFSVNINIVSVI